MGGGGGTFAPAFGGLINDPTAQMGYQVGKTALNAGQEYMEQNVYIILLTPDPWFRLTADLRPLLDKPLRLHLSSETLLQRLHPLRPAQTPPRPFPLATQALVPGATSLPFYPG